MLVRYGSPNIDGMARYLSRARTPGAILSVLASLSLLCAACSTGSTPSSGEESRGSSAGTSTAGTSTADSTSAAGTRQVQTDLGEVTVPDRAERVIAADYFVGFTLMDLGIEPVGVSGSDYSDQGETYAEAAKDADVGTWTDVDYEAILAAKPDLIVRGIDTDEDTYARLSAIAPTVVISFQDLSLTEVTERVGAVVGRDDEAADLVAQLAARTSEISQEHADVLAANTFDLVSPTGDGQWWLYGSAWTDLTVLTQAGAELAPTAKAQTEQVVPYAFEQLDLLAEADVILLDAYTDYAELHRQWSVVGASP